MTTFAQTINPTPFGLFDSDTDFQTEADRMVTFVKTKLGDPQITVELSKKDVWNAFEEATSEYGAMINGFQVKSELSNLLGISTGSQQTNKYARQTLEFLMRQAEPYAMEAGIGGAYDTHLGYIELEYGRQDYNLYTELKNASGTLLLSTLPSSSQTNIKVLEVMHFNPSAAQQSLLNASNVTNFLATEFAYESYVNSTVFYVLPVYEDILRRSMLEMAGRVRRSNYSYQINGRIIRIYPTPNSNATNVGPLKLWFRVSTKPDPYNPSITDTSINGVSNISNVPFGNLTFANINSIGRQWIRQYTFSLCKYKLGHVRSKLKIIPIPGQELQLDGEELKNEAKEEKDKLKTELKELLTDLTYDKLVERDAAKAENLNRQLRFIPFIKPITTG